MSEHEEHASGGVGLRRSLEAILPPDRVLTRTIDRIAFANDASVYRLVPRGVVQPRSIEEVQDLFRFSHASSIPLTFRAAGTSLSGQAVTDGVLVDVSRHWRGVWVEEGGKKNSLSTGRVSLPDFADHRQGLVLRVLHQELLNACMGNSWDELDHSVLVRALETMADHEVA